MKTKFESYNEQIMQILEPFTAPLPIGRAELRDLLRAVTSAHAAATKVYVACNADSRALKVAEMERAERMGLYGVRAQAYVDKATSTAMAAVLNADKAVKTLINITSTCRGLLGGRIAVDDILDEE